MNLLLLMAALVFPTLAVGQEASQELIKEVGLVKTDKGYEYHRISLSSGKPWARLLNPEQEKLVLDFLKGLPEADRETALAVPLIKVLKEAEIPPDQHKWFERVGSGVRPSALGKNAVPGVLLGEAWESDPPDVRERQLESIRRGALLRLPTSLSMDFDGSEKRHPLELDPVEAPTSDLSFKWGTAPRAEVHANNLHTLYSIYGHGTDDLIRNSLGQKTPAGTAARAAKAGLLDIPLAYLVSLGQHEMGHFENAWMGGANDVHWEKSDGPYALGHVVKVRDWEKLDAGERQAFYAGGVNATQAALVELKRNFLEKDQVDWTFLPQWIAHKLDYTLYAAGAPRPSRAQEEDYANDMVNYARSYGSRSGRSPDSVRDTMVRGAVWNALDPLNVWAIYGYAARYVIAGEERIPNPMIPIAGREYMASTGFELGETGPKYALHLYSRNPQSGEILRVSPRVGDDHQWGLGAEWGNVALSETLRGRVGLDIWDQRGSAEPGAKRHGGAARLGLDFRLSKSAALSVDGGYKTEGDMLGHGFEKGPIVSGGLTIRY